MKDSSAGAQQELLSIPAVASGNLGAADPRLRTGFMFLIGAIEPEGTDIRTAIINPENMRNFAATGTFQKPAKAPAPGTSIANTITQDMDRYLQTISAASLSELDYNKRQDRYADANFALGEALRLAKELPRGSQNSFVAIQKVQSLNNRLITERIEALSKQGLLREFLEFFTTNYPPASEVGFAQQAPRLRYNENARIFSIENPGGGVSTFTLKAKDIEEAGRGGKTLLASLIKASNVNEQIQQLRQKQ